MRMLSKELWPQVIGSFNDERQREWYTVEELIQFSSNYVLCQGVDLCWCPHSGFSFKPHLNEF